MIVRRATFRGTRGRAPGGQPVSLRSRQAGSRRRLLAAFCLAAAVSPGASAAGAVRAATSAEFRTEALTEVSPATAAATRSAAGARTTTLRLRAAKRFSLAGLRWDSGAPLAGWLRAKRTDGTWTRWEPIESKTRTADGVAEGGDPQVAAAAEVRARKYAAESSTEPIWTGPATLLEVRVQGAAPKGLRAAFVDVSDFEPVAARAARTDQAGIQPRSAWDPGDACKPRATPAIGTTQAVTVHHTAGSNAYTQDQVPAVILAICKYHRNGQGWNDVGYNVIVDKFGGAWEGRAGGLTQAVIGAHAQGFNSVSASVSVIGDYSVVAPPPAAVATIARVSAWKLAVAGTPQSGTVTLTSAGGPQSRVGAGKTITLPRLFAHRDVGQTSCPGDAAYAQIDAVRSAAGASNPVVPVTLPSTPTQPATPKAAKITINTKRTIVIGATSVVSGTATQGGRPLAKASLALQIGGGSSWSTVARAVTSSSGKYSFARKFTRSWGMRVVFTGSGGGQSTAVKMTVAPKLTLAVPKRMRVGKKITLKGSIAPGRGPVVLQISRRGSNGNYVSSGSVRVKQKGRTLTVAVTPKSAALYRFQLTYAGSKLAGAAKSSLGYGRAVSSSAKTGGASV